MDEVTNDQPEQRTLSYEGRVDPPVGYVMGPGPNGKAWSVVGVEYDPEDDKTRVTVELAVDGL